jgi:hypothetical protein
MKETRSRDRRGSTGISRLSVTRGARLVSIGRLNRLRDEAGEFMGRIGAAEDTGALLDMTRRELVTLSRSQDDAALFSHKMYDVLFLIMEVAHISRVDLEAEWVEGRRRKKVKYGSGGPGEAPRPNR